MYLYNCSTLNFINERIFLRVLLKIIQMLILNAQKQIKILHLKKTSKIN